MKLKKYFVVKNQIKEIIILKVKIKLHKKMV